TVTIYRKDRTKPFIWEAYYDECVQRTSGGAVTKFWQKSRFMTKKVAISQAFRLCFSDELGGMPYTSDEMPEIEQTHDVGHVEVIERAVTALTDSQLKKLLTMPVERLESNLNAIEEGKLTATQVQVLAIENKLKELKNNE
ncbi:MAG: recombinase RecT, partial [Flavobacterium sp.]